MAETEEVVIVCLIGANTSCLSRMEWSFALVFCVHSSVCRLVFAVHAACGGRGREAVTDRRSNVSDLMKHLSSSSLYRMQRPE